MPNTEKYAKYDAAEFLRTPAEIRQFLEIVFEENQDDPATIAAAIGAAPGHMGWFGQRRRPALLEKASTRPFPKAAIPVSPTS